jgi:hypothetical protein
MTDQVIKLSLKASPSAPHRTASPEILPSEPWVFISYFYSIPNNHFPFEQHVAARVLLALDSLLTALFNSETVLARLACYIITSE